jgi:hypothetical protein
VSESRAQATPDLWFQILIVMTIMIASTVMAQTYPVAWMSFPVQVFVGVIVIAGSAIGGAWAMQLAHGWWRKQGETA